MLFIYRLFKAWCNFNFYPWRRGAPLFKGRNVWSGVCPLLGAVYNLLYLRFRETIVYLLPKSVDMINTRTLFVVMTFLETHICTLWLYYFFKNNFSPDWLIRLLSFFFGQRWKTRADFWTKPSARSPFRFAPNLSRISTAWRPGRLQGEYSHCLFSCRPFRRLL